MDGCWARTCETCGRRITWQGSIGAKLDCPQCKLPVEQPAAVATADVLPRSLVDAFAVAILGERLIETDLCGDTEFGAIKDRLLPITERHEAALTDGEFAELEKRLCLMFAFGERGVAIEVLSRVVGNAGAAAAASRPAGVGQGGRPAGRGQVNGGGAEKSRKLPPPKVEPNFEAEAALEQCDDILDAIEQLPSRASDFGESIGEKVRGIAATINERGIVTTGQLTALTNMQRGVEKWFAHG